MQVSEIDQKILGADGLETLKRMLDLVSTYRGVGEKPRKLIEQVIKRRKQLENHADTADSVGKLALIYKNQGCWKEAKGIMMHVIGIKKLDLGRLSRNTDNYVDSEIENQRCLNEADKLMSVFKARKKQLGFVTPAFLKFVLILNIFRFIDSEIPDQKGEKRAYFGGERISRGGDLLSRAVADLFHCQLLIFTFFLSANPQPIIRHSQCVMF